MRLSSDRYRHIGLEHNPFPAMPTPSKATFVSGRDRKEKLQTLLEQIARVKREGISISIGIVGDYGDGKSHMLKHLEYQLSKVPSMNPEENIVLYIHRPYDPRETCDLVYLCSLIIDQLTLTHQENLLHFLVLKIYTKVALQILKEGTSRWKTLVKGGIFGFRSRKMRETLILRLESDFRSVSEEETEIDLGRLHQEVRHRLTHHFETRNFKTSSYIAMPLWKSMTDLVFQGHPDTAWKPTMEPFLRNNEEARKFLKTIVNLSIYAGYKVFVLLLDEIDQIPEPDLRTLLGELTLFLEESGENAPPRRFLVILSYTPKLGESLSPFYLRRIVARTSLGTVTKEETREIIRDYLNEARASPSNLLAPFDNESAARLWETCQGRIGDLLKWCFWVVEELAQQKSEQATGEVVAAVQSRYQGGFPLPHPPPHHLQPLPLDRERVLALYDSRIVDRERSKAIEDAVRTLCSTLRGHRLNSVTITSVWPRRHRLSIGGRRTREVDIYLQRQQADGTEESIAIEVKAYKRREPQGVVSLTELEGPFELLEAKSIDKLCIFTNADLDVDVLSRMREFGDRAVRCQIDDDQLAQLLYVTDRTFFGRELSPDEARQAAEEIGLLQHLRG